MGVTLSTEYRKLRYPQNRLENLWKGLETYMMPPYQYGPDMLSVDLLRSGPGGDDPDLSSIDDGIPSTTAFQRAVPAA